MNAISHTRRDFLKDVGLGVASLALPRYANASEEFADKGGKRPNILWIIADDMSCDLGCYGRADVKTPNIDRLASEGMRFTNAFSTAPVCSPARSAFITGMHAIAIGSHNHRDWSIELPKEVQLIPKYFHDAGYFCTNSSGYNFDKFGKTDYDFQWNNKTAGYEDTQDWAKRKPGQPFFAQVQFFEPHRKFNVDRQNPIEPNKVSLPPYYPDHPLVRIDFEQYLETIQILDRKIGKILEKLGCEADAENTIVFFWSDQGRPFPRDKKFLYDGGTKVPLIIRWPGKIRPGSVSDDLVSSIDFGPTCMSLAGLKVPEYMNGKVFLGPSAEKREYIFTARDRIDETVDRIRAVRTKRYKYIRNFYPDVPYNQFAAYTLMMHPTLSVMRKLHAEGKLTAEQAKWMAKTKPPEELYDIQNDADELNNLANDEKYQEVLVKLRNRLDKWLDEMDDKGRVPEDQEKLALKKKHFKEYKEKTLKEYGLTSDEQLYDYWKDSLKPTKAALPDK